jgi:polyphosphate kinase 2 (PPK2 family)
MGKAKVLSKNEYEIVLRKLQIELVKWQEWINIQEKR